MAKAPKEKPSEKEKLVEVGRQWPADKVERRAVSELVPYARNARTHSPEQVDQIAASIREWGWTTAVLIDEKGGIIAGHGRILAAHKLGIKDVPTMMARGWTEAQKRAYILADNKLALNAGWDAELLKTELLDLDHMNVDLTMLGWSDEELADIFAPIWGDEDMERAEETPEPPVNPVTVLGDVWILGNHRLVCGDSTNADDVAKAIDGQMADLCFTSPPYAQQRNYKQEITDWDSLMNGVFSILPVKAGSQILVNLGLVHEEGRVNQYWVKWLDFMAGAGWPLFGWYVWDKGFGLPGNWNGRLAPSHEFIFHFSKGGNKPANKWVAKKPENIGIAKLGTGLRGKDGKMSGLSSPESSLQPNKIADSVIRITPQMSRKTDTSHPAMFPVALCDAIYKSYAKQGDWVFEPFSGSGTSIMACEVFGAQCAAIELAPAYVDVAVQRWQDFTKKKATLEATGQTFDEVSDARYDPDKNSADSYTVAIAEMRKKKEAAA